MLQVLRKVKDSGAIKRHGQSRGPMSHGSRYHRRPGSMGPVAPNRVFKIND